MSETITLEQYQQLTKPRNKFGAKKVEVDGVCFDSMREGQRFRELKILERIGAIKNLKLQPEFPLIVNGKKVCSYVADFSFWDARFGESVIEDVKSKATKTPLYQLKKKLFEALYERTITEIF
jgi:hypothetical protein